MTEEFGGSCLSTEDHVKEDTDNHVLPLDTHLMSDSVSQHGPPAAKPAADVPRKDSHFDSGASPPLCRAEAEPQMTDCQAHAVLRDVIGTPTSLDENKMDLLHQKPEYNDVMTQDVSEGLLMSHNQPLPDNSSSIQDTNFNKVDLNPDKQEHIKSEPSELTSEAASSFQDEISPVQSVPSRKNSSVTLKEDPRITCDDSETSTSIPAEISSVDFLSLNTKEGYQKGDHMEAGGSVSQTPTTVESQRKKTYYSFLHQMQQQQKHKPGRKFKKKTLMKMAKLFVIAEELDSGKIQSPLPNEPSAEHETLLLNQREEMFSSAALVASQRVTTETNCVRDEENDRDNKTVLLTVSSDATSSGQTAAAATFKKVGIPSSHKEQGKEESEPSAETDCNTSADLLNKSDTAQETVLCSRPTTGPKKKRRWRKGSSVILKEDPRITCDDSETSSIPAEISSVDAPKTKVFKQRKNTARASKVDAKKKIQKLFTEFNDVKTQDVSEGLLISQNEKILACSSPVQDNIFKGVDLNADKQEHMKSEPSELTSEAASSFHDEISPVQSIPSVVPARKIKKRRKRNNFDKETVLSAVSTDTTLSGQTAAAITVKNRKIPSTRKKQGKQELMLSAETKCNTSADLLNKSDTAQETVLCSRPTTGRKKKRRSWKRTTLMVKEDPRITCDDSETSTSIPAEISSVDAPKTKVFKQRKKTGERSKVGVKKNIKQNPEYNDLMTQDVSEGLLMSRNQPLPDNSSSIQDTNFNKVDLNADKQEHIKSEPSELTSEAASSFQDEISPVQSVPSRKNSSVTLKEDPRITCDDSETSTSIPAEISSVDFLSLNTKEGYQKGDHMEAGGSVSQTPTTVESQRKKTYYSFLHQMQQQQKHKPGRKFKKKTLMKMAKLFVNAKESDSGKIQSPLSNEPSAEHETLLLNQREEIFSSAALVASQQDTTETNCVRDEENDRDNKTVLLTVSSDATSSGQTAVAATFKKVGIPSSHKEQGKEESEPSAETDCNTSADLLNKSDTAQETVLCSRPTTGPKKKRRWRKSRSVILKEDPRITCDDSETSTSIPAEISSVDAPKTKVFKQRKNTARASKVGAKKKIQELFTEFNDVKTQDVSEDLLMSQNEKNLAYSSPVQDNIFKGVDLNGDKPEHIKSENSELTSEAASSFQDEISPDQSVPSVVPARKITTRRRRNNFDKETVLSTVSTDTTLSGQTAAAITVKNRKIPSTRKKQGKQELMLSAETKCNTSADLLNKSDTAQETVLCSRPTTGRKKKRRSWKRTTLMVKEDPRITFDNVKISTSIQAEISSFDEPKTKVFKQKKKTARSSKVGVKKNIKQKPEYNDEMTQDVSEGLLMSHNQPLPGNSSSIQDTNFNKVDLNADKQEHIKSEPSELTSEAASSFQDEISPVQSVPSRKNSSVTLKEDPRITCDDSETSTSIPAEISSVDFLSLNTKEGYQKGDHMEAGGSVSQTPTTVESQRKKTYYSFLHQMQQQQKHKPGRKFKKKTLMKMAKLFVIAKESDSGKIQSPLPNEPSAEHETLLLNQREEMFSSAALVASQRVTTETNCVRDEENDRDNKTVLLTVSSDATSSGQTAAAATFKKVGIPSSHKEQGKEESEPSAQTDCNTSADLLNKSDTAQETVLCSRPTTGPKKKRRWRKGSSVILKEDPRITCDDSETSSIPAEISSVDAPKTKVFKQRKKAARTSKVDAKKKIQKLFTEFNDVKTQDVSEDLLMSQNEKNLAYSSPVQDKIFKGVDLNADKQEHIKSEPSELTSEAASSFQDEISPDQSVPSAVPARKIAKRRRLNDFDKETVLSTVSTDTTLSGQTAAAITVKNRRIPSTRKKRRKEESEPSAETDCNTSADLLNKSDTAQETVLCSRPTTGPKKKRRWRKNSSVTLREDPRITCDDSETSTSIPAEISSVDAPKTKVFKQRKKTGERSKVGVKKKTKQNPEYNDVMTQALLVSHDKPLLNNGSSSQDTNFNKVDLNADKQEHIKSEPSELTSEAASSFQDEISPVQSVPSRKNSSVTLKEDPRITCDDSETSTSIPAEISSVDFLSLNTKEGYQKGDHMEAGGSVSQTPTTVESQRKKTYYSFLHQMQQQQKHKPGRKFKKKTLMKMAKLFVNAKESDSGKIQSPLSNEPSAEHETLLLNQREEIFSSAALVASQRVTTETNCVRDEENDRDNKTVLLTVSSDATSSGQTAAAATFKKVGIPSSHKEQGKEESEPSAETDCNTSADLLNKSDTAQETVLCSRPTTGPKKKRRWRKSSSVILKEDPRITCDDSETSSIPAEISSVDAPKTKVFKQRKNTARASKVDAKKKIQELFTEFNDVKTQDVSEDLLMSQNEKILAYSSPVQDIFKGVDLNGDKPEHIKSENSELTSEAASSFQDEISPDQSVPSVVPARKITTRQRRNNFDKETVLSTVSTDTTLSGQTAAAITVKNRKIPSTHKKQGKQELMLSAETKCNTSADLLNKSDTAQETVLCSRPTTGPKKKRRWRKSSSVTLREDPRITCDDSQTSSSIPAEISSVDANKTKVFKQRKKAARTSKVGVKKGKQKPEFNDVKTQDVSEGLLMSQNEQVLAYSSPVQDIVFKGVDLNTDKQEHIKSEPSELTSEAASSFQDEISPVQVVPSQKSSSVILKEDPRITCDDSETLTSIPAEISSVDAPKTKVFKRRKKKARASKVGVKKNKPIPEYHDVMTQDASEGLLMSHNQSLPDHSSSVQDTNFNNVDLNPDKQEHIKSEPSELTSEAASSFQDEISLVELAPSVAPARKTIRKRRRRNKTGWTAKKISKRPQISHPPDDDNVKRRNIIPMLTANTKVKHSSKPTNHRSRRAEVKPQKPLECSFCRRSFRHITALTVHRRIHTGGKPYSCPTCGKRFAQLSQLSLHSTTHGEPSAVHCPCCGETFKSKDELISHFPVHLNNSRSSSVIEHPTEGEQAVLDSPVTPERFRCPVCFKEFLNRATLKMHGRTHGQKPYTCTVCGKKFRKPSSLTAHERTHWPVKPYSCSVCCEGFIKLQELKRHSQMHSGATPFTCPRCEKTFSSFESLRSHQAVELCSEKQNNAPVNRSVNNGFLVSHSVEGQIVTPMYFKCHICEQLHRHWCQYVLHLRAHAHGESSTCEACRQRSEQACEMRSHCTVCCRMSGEERACRSSLTDFWKEPEAPENQVLEPHLDVEGVPPGEDQAEQMSALPQAETGEEEVVNMQSPSSVDEGYEVSNVPNLNLACERLSCSRSRLRRFGRLSLGGRSFSRWNKLWLHQRLHRQKPTFSCSRCELEFRFMGSYMDHLREHAAQTPFACPLCPDTFANVENASTHISECHERQDLFKCSACGKNYSTLRNLKKHKLLHKGTSSHVCLPCSVSFSSNGALKTHLKTHSRRLSVPQPAGLVEPLLFPYHCRKCAAAFSSTDLLQAHQVCHFTAGKKPETSSESVVSCIPSSPPEDSRGVVSESSRPKCHLPVSNKKHLFRYPHPDRLYVVPVVSTEPPIVLSDTEGEQQETQVQSPSITTSASDTVTDCVPHRPPGATFTSSDPSLSDTPLFSGVSSPGDTNGHEKHQDVRKDASDTSGCDSDSDELLLTKEMDRVHNVHSCAICMEPFTDISKLHEHYVHHVRRM